MRTYVLLIVSLNMLTQFSFAEPTKTFHEYYYSYVHAIYVAKVYLLS